MNLFLYCFYLRIFFLFQLFKLRFQVNNFIIWNNFFRFFYELNPSLFFGCLPQILIYWFFFFHRLILRVKYQLILPLLHPTLLWSVLTLDISKCIIPKILSLFDNLINLSLHLINSLWNNWIILGWIIYAAIKHIKVDSWWCH